MVLSPSNPIEQAQWLNNQLGILRRNLRPGQQNLADWNGGEMAVSAVPGAGKSHSLAIAAAIAIAKHQLHSRQQLVIPVQQQPVLKVKSAND